MRLTAIEISAKTGYRHRQGSGSHCQTVFALTGKGQACGQNPVCHTESHCWWTSYMTPIGPISCLLRDCRWKVEKGPESRMMGTRLLPIKVDRVGRYSHQSSG